MQFTLKGYQDTAVREVLANLRDAADFWRTKSRKLSFSLTAVTGAGKTVMASAVFEALFYGDESFDFEADPGAVVIWFSDDPSLNEQTRARLRESSDRLKETDLVVVQNTFCREKFETGKVYFLNTQKLGKKSLLVRGFEDDDPAFEAMRPDSRSFTIWDTIQNTIDDPLLTLYLVLDEAHRGMGIPTKAIQNEKTTIVKRLINGSGTVSAIPIVWGISATIERFRNAMKEAEGRGTLPDVMVDSAKVQESGLLKDTIILDVPNEVGLFDTVLVRRATDKIIESSKAWDEYSRQQGTGESVKPLMVLQVPNMPDPDEIGRAIDTIQNQWAGLTYDAFAHVFGEHTTMHFGGHAVPYISPERVQGSPSVRVLIAKDAISTGWDCPRAEVMVSFRSASDRTHITQLLGRMVRTPLARRIPGNDRLNSVDCLLPKFNSSTVQAVADDLMKGGGETDEGEQQGRRVLINAKEMTPNPTVPEAVWDKFLTLPAQSLPQRGAKPIKRLTALAHELAFDGLLPDAGKKAHAEMHKVLDAAQARYADDIDVARRAVLVVEGRTMRADMATHAKTFDDFVEAADVPVIEDAYRRSCRILSPDVAKTYAEYLARRKPATDMEQALLEAHADIAALGLVPAAKDYLDSEADKLANDWFIQFRIQIKNLSDERQDVYRQIKAWSADPKDIDLAKPTSWMMGTVVRGPDGSERLLPTYEHHLLCDEDGLFPAEAGSSWEPEVLSREMQRSGFKAWYRNPSRSSQDSLGIAYRMGADYKIVRPDFIFFSVTGEGLVVADIVDPHGTYLGDAIPKLKGLVEYTKAHPKIYRRVDAIAKVGDKLRVLDLTDVATQSAVEAATDAKSLYEGPHATDY